MTDDEFMDAVVRLKRQQTIPSPLFLSEDDWFKFRPLLEALAFEINGEPTLFVKAGEDRLHFLFMGEPVFIDPDLPNLYSPGS